MRTRSNSRSLLGVLALTLSLAGIVTCARAQENESDTSSANRPHLLLFEAGGGIAASVGPKQTVPTDAREVRVGFAATGRALWRPGHLLGIGLQSGYLRIASMRTAQFDEPLFLAVIPAMIVFAMEAHDIEVSVATGWYRYMVSTNTRTISGAWEMGYHASVAYTPLHFGDFGVGMELSYANLPERNVGAGSVQVRVAYEVEL